MRAGDHEEAGGCHGAIIIPRMLLAVDIGNTQTHIGAFDGAELAHDWRLHTDARATSDELAATLSNLLALDGHRASARSTLRSSQPWCPSSAPSIAGSASATPRGGYLKVGPNLKTGMAILVDNPHELGADRLVNAVAAHDQVAGSLRHGRLRHLDQLRCRLGRGRVPGRRHRPRRRDLARGADRPHREAARGSTCSSPGSAIGKNTVAAIQSGFAYGFAGLVDGDRNRGSATSSASRRASIATGGLAATIAPHCETIDEVDPLLTLRGLRLIHERNA